ncbi:unnamed protein product [Brassicogethes aeneus]|uniref:Clathrin light chain n=1 Tax=Brassicogethes aeneus TaxID=1431903 RepID=A0A9P0B9W3_BRAAE|nr:unnamed protein product [Brassicogethes aeneus]
MSGFGDNFDSEVDPAAEFLAREQDELAGLEDDVKPAAISVSAVNGDDPTNTNSASSFEMVENNEQDGIDVKTEPNDDFLFSTNDNEFNDQFLFSTNENIDYDFQQINKDINDAIYDRATPSPPRNEAREEPEKIKKWREEQVKRLEEKGIKHLFLNLLLKAQIHFEYKLIHLKNMYFILDKEEEKKKLELREVAKKELEDWYKNHADTIEKTKAANRSAEKQFVAEEDAIQPGTEWERIAKLCDFNPKAKQGSKDVSRMRSIILQMKQSPVPIKNSA